MQSNIHSKRIKELFPNVPEKEREGIVGKIIKKSWDCIYKTADQERGSNGKTKEVQSSI